MKFINRPFLHAFRSFIYLFTYLFLRFRCYFCYFWSATVMGLKIENCCNKSTTSSIRFVMPVFDTAECYYYTMVYTVDIAHLRCLLFGAKILSIFIKVRECYHHVKHFFRYWQGRNFPEFSNQFSMFFLLEFYFVFCPLTQFPIGWDQNNSTE